MNLDLMAKAWHAPLKFEIEISADTILILVSRFNNPVNR